MIKLFEKLEEQILIFINYNTFYFFSDIKNLSFINFVNLIIFLQVFFI